MKALACNNASPLKYGVLNRTRKLHAIYIMCLDKDLSLSKHHCIAVTCEWFVLVIRYCTLSRGVIPG